MLSLSNYRRPFRRPGNLSSIFLLTGFFVKHGVKFVNKHFMVNEGTAKGCKRFFQYFSELTRITKKCLKTTNNLDKNNPAGAQVKKVGALSRNSLCFAENALSQILANPFHPPRSRTHPTEDSARVFGNNYGHFLPPSVRCQK